MVSRLENWPLRLSKYLNERSDKPFEWGKNDCLMFVSGAVAAVTGYDFSDEYLPYSTRKEADEMLQEYDGVVGIISEHLGHSGTEKILTAQRGDVVLFRLNDENIAGIVDDSGRFFQIVTEKGLLRVPLKRAVRVWSY